MTRLMRMGFGFLFLAGLACAAPKRVGDRIDFVGTVLDPFTPSGIVTGSSAPNLYVLYGGFSVALPSKPWSATLDSLASQLHSTLSSEGWEDIFDSSNVSSITPSRLQLSASKGASRIEITVWLAPLPDGKMCVTYTQCEMVGY